LVVAVGTQRERLDDTGSLLVQGVFEFVEEIQKYGYSVAAHPVPGE
jgi:hypothetical protein